MAPTPPSFGSQNYWNERFTSNSNPFEWLEAPDALDPYIVEALKESGHLNPQLLHIGCGTSLLSYHLRTHVERTTQIHNLDYSEVAVKLGKEREYEIFKADEVTTDENESPQAANGATAEASSHMSMRWLSADILDHNSFLQVCKPATYSIVVDKSTSDSIACSDDLYVPLPYHIVTSSKIPSKTVITRSTGPLHPLHIMAVNLALVTKPGGRWITLSYSMDRYPFLRLTEPKHTDKFSASAKKTASVSCTPQGEDYTATEGKASLDALSLDGDLDDLPSKVLNDCFPDPSSLWRLIGKYNMEPQVAPEASNGNGPTHRPNVMHWVYILERTDVPLFVRT